MASIKLETICELFSSRLQLVQKLWTLRDPEKTQHLSFVDNCKIMYGGQPQVNVRSNQSIDFSSRLNVNLTADAYYLTHIDRINYVCAILGVTIDFSTCTKDDMLFLIEFNKHAQFFNFAINKYNSTRNRENRIKVKDIRAHMVGKGSAAFGWDRVVDSAGIERRFISVDWLISSSWAASLKLLMLEQGYIRNTTFGPREASPCEIMPYSTKVEEILPYKDTGNTLFGIELELENATPENIKIVHDHLKKHAIMKRDGSLQNGVEIVSIPSSIEHHKEMYKPFFENTIHSLAAKPNCGIHIHASKKNISFLALGRMMKFMAKNKGHIVKIAGRTSDQYAAIRTDWDITAPWYAAADKYSAIPRFNWSKYTGLNILPNRTMEFRIFKSTTDFKEFCRFLEFTESFIQYHTLAGDDNHGKIRKLEDMFEFSNYSDFVTARASVWPNLAKFIRTI